FHAEDGIRDFHVTGVQTCSSDLRTLCWMKMITPHVSSDMECALTSVESPRDLRRMKRCRFFARWGSAGHWWPPVAIWPSVIRHQIGRASCRGYLLMGV